jgi:hypothetical protein
VAKKPVTDPAPTFGHSHRSAAIRILFVYSCRTGWPPSASYSASKSVRFAIALRTLLRQLQQAAHTHEPTFSGT